jgi:hypothetical protein
MIKATFYKEWVKTRWFLLAIFATALVAETIIFLKLGRSFRYAGHEHLWDVVINRKQFLFSLIKYYPLLAGVILAAAQFVPETISSRFKLSLHLPFKETNISSAILGYGAGWLFIIFFVSFISIVVGAKIIFATEIANWVLVTILPWYIAGFIAYFLFAFAILEPLWKRKIVNALLSAFLLWSFYIKSIPGSYQNIIYLLPLLILVSILLVFYSIYRYKTGVQAIYN